MPSHTLLFWKPGPGLRLSAEEVARELVWGEDVPGLIDLPVKEIIQRLKEAFADHDERPGVLLARAAEGSFEATWTWQHVRIDCFDLSADERQRLCDVLAAFGCTSMAREG